MLHQKLLASLTDKVQTLLKTSEQSVRMYVYVFCVSTELLTGALDFALFELIRTPDKTDT